MQYLLKITYNSLNAYVHGTAVAVARAARLWRSLVRRRLTYRCVLDVFYLHTN